ncbi:hypothetical protein HRR83_002459 [Exophiala dermatitidis]|uniref:Cupin type-1 domain-containing protein n=2 Tax=Exophiala dermatitidis TaxID=5970 RepID=H6C0T4_EXODN|nr:uncharacterized protein HMPREF1120_04540 [Exophiala dermatitidis NIH/UT8656]KAJ4520457.1 hypothetical protein HRR75_002323 [Exophiala dermatitidis]EHY56458.1 hypothetical protein HMPREF1120_04540 [Exophiala dermatitidis NIH/UT8656]KAJ4524338.1 hypothetical protein HRR74_002536 [Exophiala dermatitidis]KAJ4525389.1 hypothetical protein HRR73_002118 [Exophiala dermatitidis]KAJ4536703.1 hypothetical protein HRR76_004730 [Exophiala dermatitidis]
MAEPKVETISKIEIQTYHLPPTRLIPNSPHRPLIYYPGLLHLLKDHQKSPADNNHHSSLDPTRLATIAYDTFISNGWDVQWIYRYGRTQRSHYHSSVHECMAVLSGSATIRFGIADGEADGGPGARRGANGPTSTHDPPSFKGVFIHARAGDVFVLPAGVAHKTYDTEPNAEFALLTPGDGHRIEVPPDSSSTSTTNAGSAATDANASVNTSAAARKRNAVIDTPLSGFTMLGAYPRLTETGQPDPGEWDFATGGEDVGRYERVWSVKKPARDPCLGVDERGLWGLW